MRPHAHRVTIPVRHAGERTVNKNLKTFLIFAGAFSLACVLLFAALIAFFIVGDDRAKARATALCAPALVGVSKDVALERARQSGSSSKELQWHLAEDGSDELLVAFPAALPLTGYLCWIHAKDGVVSSTEITTVD
jgi:hypothetical protein